MKLYAAVWVIIIAIVVSVWFGIGYAFIHFIVKFW